MCDDSSPRQRPEVTPCRMWDLFQLGGADQNDGRGVEGGGEVGRGRDLVESLRFVTTKEFKFVLVVQE